MNETLYRNMEMTMSAKATSQARAHLKFLIRAIRMQHSTGSDSVATIPASRTQSPYGADSSSAASLERRFQWE